LKKLLVLLMVAGMVAGALYPAISLGQGGPERITICHRPPGNPENEITLNLPEPAAEAHLEEHEFDTLGPCDEEDEDVDVDVDVDVDEDEDVIFRPRGGGGGGPAVSFDDQELESGEIETETNISIEGNNNNQCVGALQFGNTGNFANQQGTSQYDQGEFEQEFAGPETEFAPENGTECEQAVQQSAAASSWGW
jgi:hypothetical protein